MTQIKRTFFLNDRRKTKNGTVMSFTPEKDIDGITYGQVKELSSEEIIFLLNEKQSVQNTPEKRSSESTDFKGSGYSRMGVQ